MNHESRSLLTQSGLKLIFKKLYRSHLFVHVNAKWNAQKLFCYYKEKKPSSPHPLGLIALVKSWLIRDFWRAFFSHSFYFTF